MRSATRSISLLAALLLGAPAWAQQEARLDGEGLARAAERYAYAEWPASSLARAGLDPRGIQVQGWTRVDLQVDPRRGRATLGFQVARPLAREAKGPEAFLTVSLFESPAAARKALLKTLTAVTGALTREPGLGDVAFAARDRLRVTYAAATRGNVLLVARAPGKADAAPLALAADAAVLAAAPLAAGQPLPRPRIYGAQAEGLRAGQPGRLRFELDPAAPAPSWLAAESADGQAGVVRAGDGWEVYAARAGVVRLTLHVCSVELQTAQVEVELRVGKAD